MVFSPFFGVQVTPKLQQLSSKHHDHDLGRLVGMMSEAHLKNGCTLYVKVYIYKLVMRHKWLISIYVYTYVYIYT